MINEENAWANGNELRNGRLNNLSDLNRLCDALDLPRYVSTSDPNPSAQAILFYTIIELHNKVKELSNEQ